LPKYYTSIAIFKDFDQEKSKARTVIKGKKQKELNNRFSGGPAPKIHSARVGGASRLGDSLTLPEARLQLSLAQGGICTGI